MTTALQRSLTTRMCEDCGLKQPSLGLPSDPKKKRWCSGCAKVSTSSLFIISTAIASDSAHLASGCAKGHPGSVSFDNRKCEDCKLLIPSFGLPSEGKPRWCAACAKAHAGADDVTNKRCEDCQVS